MKILQAKVMGTCFGVVDAIGMALSHDHPETLTVLGQLVHNPQTVAKLREAGVSLVNGLEELDNISTPCVMITAHGAPDRVKEIVRTKGFRLLDATCPLVNRVHKTIKKMVSDGFFPIVIGEEKHVEVKGIVGDLDEYKVIYESAQIMELPPEKRKRLGIVSQTTQNAERVDKIVTEIRELDGVAEVEFRNTVCRPTRERQAAVEELCAAVEVMVVVGGKNSSNTRKLKILCESRGVRAYHVENASEIDDGWFRQDDTVGITAGTSTPEDVIEKVARRLNEIAESKKG